jgi:Mn-dependent DtxR family transcriptional regulator
MTDRNEQYNIRELNYILDGILERHLTKKDTKRLESIKAAHETIRTGTSSRMEDYLEVILELVELKGYATTLDISRYMNVSAPSVTKMLQRLDENGYLEYEKYHGINLTQKGNQLADTIKQKHGILLEFFEILGIGHDTANQDAEGIEHHLNPKTIRQLRKFITFLKSNPKVVQNFNNF